MTLDEAIKHAKEKAKEQRYYTQFENGSMYHNCSKCAEEHEQLAEWLEELRDYRRFNGAKTFDNGFKQGEKYGYKKAIDDFEDKILSYLKHDDYGNAMDILVIADELKKEGAE